VREMIKEGDIYNDPSHLSTEVDDRIQHKMGFRRASQGSTSSTLQLEIVMVMTIWEGTTYDDVN
jgi:hypothetical protein